MNVLAFGAHGDDLEAFCAGTLARYAAEGAQVTMCVVTDGRGRPAGDPDAIARIRKAEAEASARVIGASLLWLGIPDGDLTATYEARHAFIEAIRSTNADVIITHSPDDYHPDHNVTSLLTRDASQIARTSNYPTSFAPLRKIVPVAFMETESGINFNPHEYVDVTAFWPQKLEMLLEHFSQHMPGAAYDASFVLPPADEIAIVRAARVMSEFRGLACGVKYAEGFRWWQQANRMVPRRVLP